MSGDINDSLEFSLRAGGLVYSIGIECEEDSLDWLDHALLDLCEEPQPIRELFASFPLPSRLLESALSRLLEGNFLLVDVHDGCVRASSLPYAHTRGRLIMLSVWQDHATGILVLEEQVKPFSEGRPRRERSSDVNYRRLPGGPPGRTPLEMSDAELLHRLQRLIPVSGRTTVRSRKRVGRLTLKIRAQQRDDGRLAIEDSIPWPLRATWAKLPGVAERGDENSIQLSLPSRWDEAVGRWFQESYDRARGLRSGVGATTTLLDILEADTTVELSLGGMLTTKRLAREARSSLVLAVSEGRGTPGEAVQILQESSAPERLLVLSGLDIRKDKREEWERQGIRLISTDRRQGPDFLLADTRILALGGIHSSSARVFTVRSHAALGGYIAWLAGFGITLPRGQRAQDELAREVRALEHDILDLVSHRGRDSGGTEADSRLDRVREYLKERCHTLQLRLLERGSTPVGWLPFGEVLGLVEQWTGSLRVLVRYSNSTLARTAASRGIECAAWPEPDAPADCIVTDRVVLLGFSEELVLSYPDFLAFYDADVASQIRMETYKLPQLGRAISS